MKEVNEEVYIWHSDEHQSFLQADSIIILGCVMRYFQSSQNKKFAYIYNNSRKTRDMKLIFCLEINTNIFDKLMVSLWACVARHAKNT